MHVAQKKLVREVRRLGYLVSLKKGRVRVHHPGSKQIVASWHQTPVNPEGEADHARQKLRKAGVPVK